MREYTVRDIQNRLLDMAKNIKIIFEAHDIQYMITYGTLLGAVRHQGFIPWDDDFDFYVFDDCYDRAIELLRENLPSDLFVEDEQSEPLFFHAWARVKDLRTVTSYAYYPQDAVYTHKGLSLDLYRAKFTRYKDINKFKADEYQKYIDRRRDKKLITPEEYAKREAIIADMRSRHVEPSSRDDENVISSLTSSGGFFETDLLPLKQYPFEDTTFPGPCHAEAVLTELYGDYMQLPPVAQRKMHYDKVVEL